MELLGPSKLPDLLLGVRRAEAALDAINAQGPAGAFYGQPKKMGLGDWTERALKKLGVTKERYKAAKEKFGLMPMCHCKERKEWLNKVGRWVTG